MGRKHTDLTGQRFGKLTVLARNPDHINPNGDTVIMYSCVCDCGNIVSVRGCYLRNGKTKSCGCNRSNIGIRSRKQNIFTIDGDVVRVKLSNSDKWMEVDLSNWEKIAQHHCWRYHCGYAATWKDGHLILCHVLLFPNCPKEKCRDHIDGNRLNNKASNIRFVTAQQNSWNHEITRTESGVAGVCRHGNRWRAHIYVNQKHVSLGMFDTLEEAVNARKQAEITYFGEYRRK